MLAVALRFILTVVDFFIITIIVLINIVTTSTIILIIFFLIYHMMIHHVNLDLLKQKKIFSFLAFFPPPPQPPPSFFLLLLRKVFSLSLRPRGGGLGKCLFCFLTFSFFCFQLSSCMLRRYSAISTATVPHSAPWFDGGGV